MNKLLAVAASTILGVSLVISAYLISQADFRNSNQKDDKTILTEADLANLLDVSIQDIEAIIQKDRETKKNLTSWNSYSFLPFMEIGGQKIFLEQDVEKWIMYQSYVNK